MRLHRDLERLAAEPRWDVVVVGGGIHGAACLLEAAARGLKALLVEARDFGWATSSRSSRLIHGGLRYLEHGHLRLVTEALRERRALIDAAPHLVEPLKLTIPFYAHNRRGPRRVRLGLWLYDRLAGQARLGTASALDVTALPEALGGLNRQGLSGVASFYDARVWRPERLVIEELVDAARAGALALNYVALEALVLDGADYRLTVKDSLGGRSFELRARTVVNAAGPWVDEVAQLGGTRRSLEVRWVRGTHAFWAPFPGAPQVALFCEARADRRPFFILPQPHYILVGTTEVEQRADPATTRPNRDELAYLAEEFAAVWPAAAEHAPYAAYAGVRVLAGGGGVHTRDRRHRVVVDTPRSVSIVGGKLTTHRLAAQEALAALEPVLGRPSRPSRPPALLPGAQCEPEALAPERLAQRAGIDPAAAALLLGRWGCRAWGVAAGIDTASPMPGTGGLFAAELAFARQAEAAQTLEDAVCRRTDLALAPGLTWEALVTAAQVWHGGGDPGAARKDAEQLAVLLERDYCRTLMPRSKAKSNG